MFMRPGGKMTCPSRMVVVEFQEREDNHILVIHVFSSFGTIWSVFNSVGLFLAALT